MGGVGEEPAQAVLVAAAGERLLDVAEHLVEGDAEPADLVWGSVDSTRPDRSPPAIAPAVIDPVERTSPTRPPPDAAEDDGYRR